jgi:hypothetical protein
LEEDEQVFFKDITLDFFKASGRAIDEVQSEQEARSKCAELTADAPYPVFFFDSDTSGEKLYEEFFTEVDELDMQRFSSLGVIINSKKLPKAELQGAIDELKGLLSQESYDKEQIVATMKKYLPDFEHIETGKNLDQKM